MPELPEVENVRYALSQMVTGQKITAVHVRWPNLINQISATDFERKLAGQTIHQIRRRGKYLLFDLSDYLLISHLRMEGKYLLKPLDESIDKYTHIIFELNSKQKLLYRDVRKFGRFDLLNKDQEAIYFNKKKLGPEPKVPDFDLKTFEKGLSRHQKAIKSVLLDQYLVAGIGNIYADEILFRAKIHPEFSAKALSHSSIKSLHDKIIQVMNEAVEAGGTTIRTYRNAFGKEGQFQNQLLVYGREGEPCLRCHTAIEKIKVGGRGTHYCPHCQPKDKRG